MKTGCFRRMLMTLTLLAGLCATGCTEQDIGASARASLTSFVTNIVSQVIRDALNP